MNVLVIDNDRDSCSMICQYLAQTEFDTHACGGIDSAKRSIRKLQPDCLIVDWSLPDGPGIEFISWLRTQHEYRRLPVLMLADQSGESDRVTGLESGADDYMTKPPSLRELRARLQALVRRASEYSEEALPRIVLDTRNQALLVNDREVEISRTEFKLFQFFLNNRGKVFSRQQILNAIWDMQTDFESRTVEVYVLRLRKVLKAHKLDKLIKTVRGRGYKFRADIRCETFGPGNEQNRLNRRTRARADTGREIDPDHPG